MTLKPMAVSQTVQQFTRIPSSLLFDGGCPVTTGVGSCGMHFVDVDCHPLYTRGEHEKGYTSNHSEFLGLLRVLEVLVEQKWHNRAIIMSTCAGIVSMC